MSLYENYIREQTKDHIIETEQGFATYRYLEDTRTVYILDIYVLPDFRKSGLASAFADRIVAEAKAKGYIKLIGSLFPSNKNSTASMKVLLAYGFTLESSTNDFIILKKDI